MAIDSFQSMWLAEQMLTELSKHAEAEGWSLSIQSSNSERSWIALDREIQQLHDEFAWASIEWAEKTGSEYELSPESVLSEKLRPRVKLSDHTRLWAALQSLMPDSVVDKQPNEHHGISGSTSQLHPGDDLLMYLRECPAHMAALVELPDRFLNCDLLTVCDADGYIEFGTRQYCHTGPDNQLIVEHGWWFDSITGPNRNLMSQYLAEALAFAGDERIRPHICVTAKGRIQAARLALERSRDPIEGESGAAGRANPQNKGQLHSSAEHVQEDRRPVRKPDGWTKADLVSQAKEAKGSFSDSTFDTIRKKAGVSSSPRGGKGQQRRFTRAELKELIAAVEAGTFEKKNIIVAAWRELLDA